MFVGSIIDLFGLRGICNWILNRTFKKKESDKFYPFDDEDVFVDINEGRIS